MLSKIVPVLSSFVFGQSDTLYLRGVSDNLTTSATFFFQLGKMVTPPPTVSTVTVDGVTEEISTQGDDVFSGDPSAVGNVTLDGEQYAAWSGENSTLPPLLAPKIGVTLAA